MKRKKKDLNQHSWKVHILQFLTVGFALWSWWETAAGVKLTQKLPQDQTERWMAVLLITGFLGSVWLGTMLVKRKKLLLCGTESSGFDIVQILQNKEDRLYHAWKLSYALPAVFPTF